MLICGLKLSHDGALAVVEAEGGDARLLFSWEIEKLDNNERYSPFGGLSTIDRILSANGLSTRDIDRFVIDGWGEDARTATYRTEAGDPYVLAGYHEARPGDDVYESIEEVELEGALLRGGYTSYRHVANHVSAAYCMSPFAAERADAHVLVWDGGIMPRLYAIDGERLVPRFLRLLMPMIGHMYSSFAAHFDPFRPASGMSGDALQYEFDTQVDDIGALPNMVAYTLTVAGKVMAYTALGDVRADLLELYRALLGDMMLADVRAVAKFAAAVDTYASEQSYTSADVLATFQAFVEQLLVESLTRARHRSAHQSPRLCLVGGCALNIKWNSAIRAAGIYDDVWVPPVPNDSGSAIGAACSHLLARGLASKLTWDVYAGPPVVPSEPAPGWVGRACSADELGRVLARTGEPVVVLNGRAEIGPRALGNRSILASATDPAMKDRLNRMKGRAPYRPVSPICLEADAARIFDPGCADPFMLFDHRVRAEWSDRVPAILHLDGSARLQTITSAANPTIGAVLEAYRAETGIPVLCNTSANHAGRGFFPDVRSATAWGEAPYVWSNDRLYTSPSAHCGT